jgi:hypothetical protein
MQKDGLHIGRHILIVRKAEICNEVDSLYSRSLPCKITENVKESRTTVCISKETFTI